MKTNIKTSAMCALALSVLLVLAGCGGGGGSSGGGTTTSPVKPDPTGTTIPIQPVAPSRTPPPLPQATTISPAPTSSAVENIVRTGTTGTNDPYFRPSCVPGLNGAGCYTDANNRAVNILNDDTSIYLRGVTTFHRRIEGPFDNDPSIVVPNPPRDVRTAWRQGWTGAGANILIMDDFRAFGLVGEPTNRYDPRGVHGYTVGMAANQIAPGATYYGLEAAIAASSDRRFSRVLTTYRQGGLRQTNNVEVRGNIPTIHVVNQSFGEGPVDFYVTERELRSAFDRRTNDPKFRDVANSHTTPTPLSIALSDAVITKSAGNNYGADSAFVISNVRLVSTHAPNTRERAIIVGALDRFARTSTVGEHDSVSSRARIAYYSNVAGQFPQMQERFLVEYGGSPYDENAYLCSASTTTSCNNLQVVTENVFTDRGTSYAAPRVAGFAALVRGKFPGLGGAQTAKILLDTATYQGLACHPNCNVAIYGQGRVDILDALSPIGKLQ